MILRKIKTFLTVLCAFSVLFVFSGCAGDKEIYAESSDFASYPDFWNDFNSSHDSTDSSENTTGETEIITDNSSVDNSVIENSSAENSSTDVSNGESSSTNSVATPSEDEETEDIPSQPEENDIYQGPTVFF